MFFVDFHCLDINRNSGDDEFALTIDTIQDYLGCSLSFIPEQNQWFKLFHDKEDDNHAYYKVVKVLQVLHYDNKSNHFDAFVLKYDTDANFNDEMYSALNTIISA